MTAEKTNLKRSTIDALTNVSMINNSVLLSRGNIITAMSQARDVIVRVEHADDFPEDIPMYDGLKQFLSLMKLFDDPAVTYKGNHLLISSGRNRQKFRYSDASLFGTTNAATVRVPNGDPADRVLEYDYTFNITQSEIAKIRKSASITGAPHFVVRARENTDVLEVVCTNKDSQSSTNEYTIELSTPATDPDVAIAFSVDNLKMIDGDYDVSVKTSDAPKISHWKRKKSEGEETCFAYWIAISLEKGRK